MVLDKVAMLDLSDSLWIIRNHCFIVSKSSKIKSRNINRIPKIVSVSDKMQLWFHRRETWFLSTFSQTDYEIAASIAFLRYWLIYTERKKKRRVNFIPKFHSSLKKFVKYFTMITKRYMYGTKVPNFIGLWSTSLELLKFIGSYPTNLEIKIKLKINIGCVPLLLPLLP